MPQRSVRNATVHAAPNHPEWLSNLLRLICVASTLLLTCGRSIAFDESTLPQIGMNVGPVDYFTTPYFANGLVQSSGWLESTGGNFGTEVAVFGNPQFDTNGYPRYLNPGTRLRGILYGLNANYGNRPATWPARSGLAVGKIVLTWKGDADIRLTGGTFLSAESSGASTGRLVNGRRVYRQTTVNSNITIEDINVANPITEIRAWLPDPANPQNSALEGQLFHPTALARLATGSWTWLRCMDWNSTNASPQQDWSDRRLPSHAFQTGVINARGPANGFAGNRVTGVAYEYMVALCNAANKDLWINVPHLATADHTTKLAQLVAFGSDGVDPYTSPQSNPVFAPLNPGLRVYVEYSNEIWSNGSSFAQGNWAQDQATAAGISKARFNGRRFCEVWAIFQSVFGSNARLVRVGAVFTGNQTYTQDFLNEIRTYGATLSPPQEPDVIAATTYFGNGIQDWAYARAQTQAGTGDPWFLTTGTFDSGGGVLRPVSVAASDPYWTGPLVQQHLNQTFEQWKRLLLSGATQTGGGPDATGIGGGFDVWLRNLALTTFPTRKPIVTYEGGPSLYSDYLDGGDVRDDGITTFLELLNRQPQIAEIYRIHLNQAKAKGLRTHGAFFDGGIWGKFGQWGHLEFADQPPSASVKWSFLSNWETEMSAVRHIDDVIGTAPQFVTAAKLPTALWGNTYSAAISTTGGEGARTLESIGQALGSGLGVSLASGNGLVSGTPAATGDSYAFLRVRDADGDPSWRTFYVKTVGGPRVVVESNFEGANPSATIPWTPAHVKSTGLGYSGWSRGTGIAPATGSDALAYSQNMPAVEVDSTLAAAISANQYWTTTIQSPGGQSLDLRAAELRFTIRRIDFHAPRRYAVFTSIGGFAAGSEIFSSVRFASTVDQEFVFALPDTAAYGSLTGPVEFRIVGFAGQFAGHRTSINAFKLTRNANGFDRWVEANFTPAQQVATGVTHAANDPDGDGVGNLLEYAFGTSPNLPTGESLAISGASLVRRGLPVCDTRVLGDGASIRALFTRRKDFAASGISYTVQFSADLVSWQDGTADPTLTASDAEMEALTVPFPAVLASGGAARYFRVRIAVL